jgi:hypothetical protein
VKRDDELGLWLLLGVYVIAKLESPARAAVKALERGGSKVFDALHPSQRNHANDLPGHQLTRAALMDLATRAGFPNPRLAVAVALAESGGVPQALGDGGLSVGLWQIHLPSWPMYSHEQMNDPVQNAHAAFVISKGGTDWRHWTTFRNGRYRDFL